MQQPLVNFKCDWQRNLSSNIFPFNLRKAFYTFLVKSILAVEQAD